MLAINSKNTKAKGCAPVSSNCVIWEGPDLECIGVCHGDTISIVIAKLAGQLCELVNMFKLEDFDYACLGVPTSQQPADAGELIQILIDRICALEQIAPGTPGTTPGDCPTDCIVPIASCFYTINAQGDQVTTMPLLDYIGAIGNEICTLQAQIVLLEADVLSLQSQLNLTNVSVSNLEIEKADIDSLNYTVNTYTDPNAGTVYITNALRYVETSLINTQQALGFPTRIYEGMAKAGNIDEEPSLVNNGVPMSGLDGWISNPTNLADDEGNKWITLRDLREAVAYMQDNCCSTGCDDIFLNWRASLDGTFLTVFTDGSTGFTSEWTECTGTTRVTVVDSAGNSTSFTTSLLALINQPAGYSIDLAPTSVDVSLDLTVTAESCFLNTPFDTTCEKDYVDIIQAPVTCPATVITAYTNYMTYQFASSVGFSYIVNIYYNAGVSSVATQSIAEPGVLVFNTITGLLPETVYQFELTVLDSQGETTVCPRQQFTTLSETCTPAIGVTASITLVTP